MSHKRTEDVRLYEAWRARLQELLALEDEVYGGRIYTRPPTLREMADALSEELGEPVSRMRVWRLLHDDWRPLERAHDIGECTPECGVPDVLRSDSLPRGEFAARVFWLAKTIAPRIPSHMTMPTARKAAAMTQRDYCAAYGLTPRHLRRFRSGS